MSATDTIFALASGHLPSGIAIVRASGPAVRFAVATICGSAAESRRASYRTFRSASGEVIDRGVVTFLPGPASFTGEDCVEFGLHGGKAVVARFLEMLGEFDGFRMADAGEFTRRAMLNGKMDLVEVEALADLITAETEVQRRFAVENSDGRQGVLYEEWRRRIIFGRAMLEAELDFSDEDDVPGSVADTVWAEMLGLARSIEAHIAGYKSAEIIREGFRVVILGAPNAGKSSLLNALAKRDVAIVADEPGTTRDLVEVVLDLEGVKVVLTDTAGIREGGGVVENIGIERALGSARRSDLVVLLTSLVDPEPISVKIAGDVLRVGSKADLVDANFAPCGEKFEILTSSATGAGLSDLVVEIGRRARCAIGEIGNVAPSRARHVQLLRTTSLCLKRAAGSANLDLELRAEELRQASDALGRIVGRVDVEDLLGVIFGEFCVGK